jgi:hypothetical protein
MTTSNTTIGSTSDPSRTHGTGIADNDDTTGTVTGRCLTEDDTCQCFLKRALFLPPGMVDAEMNINNNEEDEHPRNSKK